MEPDRRTAYLRHLQPEHLRGADLRYSLLTLLSQAGRPCSITELRQHLERLGLVIAGRNPSKTVADVLRYECHKGRVRRTGRGRYVANARPDTTTRRHRDRLRDLVAEARRRRAHTATDTA